MNLNKFTESTLVNKGCSMSVNTGIFNPKVGFFASFKASENKIPIADFSEANVLQFVINNASKLKESGNFLGSWIEDELVYIDVSRQFEHELDAKLFGIFNEQKAYYDAKEEKVINLN